MTPYATWRASVLLVAAQKRATMLGDRVLRDLLGDLEAELSEILDPRKGDGAARNVAGGS